MIRKLLLLITLLTFSFSQAQQVVSIVGTGVNGWPDNMTGPEMDLMTTDFITYTLSNVTVTAGNVKFRYNHQWDTNWGGSTFPSGTGVQGGPNIPTVAGTYDITFNRTNGTYTFIGSSAFPNIGIWGPAVDAINGWVGDDVDMTTTDGIIYKLSAFYFTSGSANFRQDNNPAITFGSTNFPTGIAFASGPNFFVPGGQYSVTFNRITGEYSFGYPSVGLMGTFNNWAEPDINMTTTNGETYLLENFNMAADGLVKLRLDDEWTVNWGGNAFPNGTMILGGSDMPVSAGTYDVSFNRNTLGIVFTPSLGVSETAMQKVSIYPNPSEISWNISSSVLIEDIRIFDLVGKLVFHSNPRTNETAVDASALASGIYFAKITALGTIQTVRLIKK